MSGYQATARIERAEVHVRTSAASAASASGGAAMVSLAGEPWDPRLAVEALHERLETVRSALDQLTFFLLDPESWRK